MDEHFYSIQILIEKHFVSWYCKRCVINLIKVQVVNHCHEKTGVQKSYFVEILIKCFRLLWHLVTQKNRKKKINIHSQINNILNGKFIFSAASIKVIKRTFPLLKTTKILLLATHQFKSKSYIFSTKLSVNLI